MRHQAVAEVLCSMPESGYRKLAERIDTFRWHIPDAEMLGLCYPFGNIVEKDGPAGYKSRYAKVLYLSPSLERLAFSTGLAVVAHELAHIALDHQLLCLPKEYQAQEDAAWKPASERGFERKIKLREATYKRRETRETKWIEQNVTSRRKPRKAKKGREKSRKKIGVRKTERRMGDGKKKS